MGRKRLSCEAWSSHRQGHLHEVWELLKTVLPEWHLPEPEPEKTPEVPADAAKKDGTNSVAAVSDISLSSPLLPLLSPPPPRSPPSLPLSPTLSPTLSLSVSVSLCPDVIVCG